MIAENIRRATWNPKIEILAPDNVSYRKYYCKKGRDNSVAVSTMFDDTQNVFNIQHPTLNRIIQVSLVVPHEDPNSSNIKYIQYITFRLAYYHYT